MTELSQECASPSVIVDVHTSVGSEPILLFGNEEQKRRWLPELASGELLGAFALTEPASGSDAASLKTTARRNGEGYVLNGTKVFITNIGRAGLYVVFARTGPDEKAAGVSAFLVPGDAPGVRVGQVFKKMGLNGSPTGELVLEDVVVPAANRLGLEGQGFTVAIRALRQRRQGAADLRGFEPGSANSHRPRTIAGIFDPLMRGNPDGSLSSAGASRAPALFPVYGWDFITDLFLLAALGGSEDKVLA